jgi:hypothetical protein
MRAFGSEQWPTDRPVPQVSVEFEVADAEAVERAGVELEKAGFTLLHAARTEPWGQTVARLQSVKGVIVGISYALHCTRLREHGSAHPPASRPGVVASLKPPSRA